MFPMLHGMVSQGGVNPLLTDLTAYWKMNESSAGSASVSRLDSIASYHLADPNNRPSATAKLSLGVDMATAINSLNVSNAAFNLAGTPAEFGFWIKPTAANSDRLVISNGSAVNLDYYITITTGTPGSIIWRIQGMSTTTLTLSMNIAVDSWYCVHCWWNGSNQFGIRVNDTSANQTATLTGTPASNGTDLKMGGNRYGRTSAVCVLDDVKFWNRVLTADERTDVYNGGAGYDFFP